MVLPFDVTEYTDIDAGNLHANNVSLPTGGDGTAIVGQRLDDNKQAKSIVVELSQCFGRGFVKAPLDQQPILEGKRIVTFLHGEVVVDEQGLIEIGDKSIDGTFLYDPVQIKVKPGKYHVQALYKKSDRTLHRYLISLEAETPQA